MPTTLSALARTHIALAVADLDASIGFYRRLLGVEPAKVRDGYAKFEPDAPALSLALNGPAGLQRDGRPDVAAALDDDGPCCRPGAVTHLGIRLPDVLALDAARTRLESTGLPLRIESDVTCCYARQDKLWAVDPDGNPWEVYVLLEDVETGDSIPGTAAPATSHRGADTETAIGPVDACCAGTDASRTCC